MDLASILVGVAIGTMVGFSVAWWVGRLTSGQARAVARAEQAVLNERLDAKEHQLAELKGNETAAAETRDRLQTEITILKSTHAELSARAKAEQVAANEKLALLEDAQQKLSNTFKALSAEALKSNNQSFLDLAKANLETFQEGAKSDLESRKKAVADLVKPLTESLTRVDTKLAELQKDRIASHATLSEQVKALASTQVELKDETGRLVNALRTPSVRGRWGEIQLKRVVEMAGMLSHCDFVEQVTTGSDDGLLRPDMIVKLPGNMNVVVDAKTPMEAYLNALEEPDEARRKEHLLHHARQTRDHMKTLASKAYWNQFQPAPDFVVMFLPGETFFSAALEQDPSLIEKGINQQVIPASPTTLIALLRAVAYGWRQETLAQSAQEISELGRTLHERLCKLAEHAASLGRQLGGAVGAYNDLVGSMESRVLVSARRFSELGASSNKELPTVTPVERSPRRIQEALLLPPSGDTPTEE